MVDTPHAEDGGRAILIVDKSLAGRTRATSQGCSIVGSWRGEQQNYLALRGVATVAHGHGNQS